MAGLLKQALTESGFQVTVAPDGREGYRLAQGHDVAIVDVMMPVMDGFKMVRNLRRDGERIPVLFLTARDTPEDLVTGLALGGDDYLVKPFRLGELLARIRSLLRRASIRSPLLRHGDVTLDQLARVAYRGEKRLSLSSTEYRLLQTLMLKAGQVVSKAEVLQSVWGDGMATHDENVVEVYVHYLRTKLEAFEQSRILVTLKGKGYVLEPAAEPH